MSQSPGGGFEPLSRRRSFFERFKNPAKAEKKAESSVDYFKVDLSPVNRVATGFLASRRGTETRALNNDPSTGKKTSVVDSAIYVPVISDDDHISDEESGEAPRPTLDYYKNCTAACARYKSCLSKYMDASKGDTAATQLSDFNELTTVEDVERALVSTCNYLEKVQGQKEDKRKGKDLAGRLRGAFAGFRQQAKNVQSFLSLLPASSEYASVICGGLAILLKAAESYEILEQSFHNALRKIKTALVDKAYVDEMHPPDAKMHGYISNLFASIFGVLEHLTQWVLQGTAKRVGKAVMKHETYPDKVNASVDEMNLCAVALCRYGDHRDKMINAKTIKVGFSATSDGIQVLDRKMDRNMEEVIRHLEKLEMQMARARVEKMVHQMVVDYMNDGSFSAQKATKRRPRSRKIEFDVKSFLSPLQKRVKLATKDAENITRGSVLSRDDEKTFSELSQHVRLRSFYQTDRSPVLLLEGGTMGGRATGRSPITFLSAKLFNACQTMQKAEGMIFSVGYFCSEHRVLKADGTALDMIITMTLQLIDQHQGFDPAVLADFQKKMVAKQRDIRDFCSIFASCVAGLPAYSSLFVLIEGLGQWEDMSSRVVDTTLVIEMLLELARAEPGEEDTSARVKCLFTTPTRTIKYKSLFDPFEVFACLDRLGSSTLMTSPRRERRG